MADPYQRALNIQNIKTKKKVKKVLDKAVPVVKDTTKKVVNKVKPLVSSVKSKVSNLKINKNVSNVANTRNVKGARLLGARAKNLFIDSTKGGWRKIKANPIVNVGSFALGVHQRTEDLMKEGYTKAEARKRAIMVEGSGMLGGFALGVPTGAATATGTGLSGGLAAPLAFGATLAAYGAGTNRGEAIGGFLADRLGMKVDKETLNQRLYQRQQKENYDNTLKAQAGGLN
jgi:hypothetical protein